MGALDGEREKLEREEREWQDAQAKEERRRRVAEEVERKEKAKMEADRLKLESIKAARVSSNDPVDLALEIENTCGEIHLQKVLCLPSPTG